MWRKFDVWVTFFSLWDYREIRRRVMTGHGVSSWCIRDHYHDDDAAHLLWHGSVTWYIVYSALTSTYIATKKEKKKKTPQERVRSSLEDSSVSGPTWEERNIVHLVIDMTNLTFGSVSACLKERMVATEQTIITRMERRNTECSTRSLLEMLGTRQLLIWAICN